MGSADRLIAIFNEAITAATDVERQRLVAHACSHDAELKQEVLSLLQVHDRAGNFLQATPLTNSTIRITEKPGDRIGRYKLLQQINEGGCGVVYMAEQAITIDLLCQALKQQGMPAEAETFYHEVLNMRRKVLSEEDPAVAMARYFLMDVLRPGLTKRKSNRRFQVRKVGSGQHPQLP